MPGSVAVGDTQVYNYWEVRPPSPRYGGFLKVF